MILKVGRHGGTAAVLSLSLLLSGFFLSGNVFAKGKTPQVNSREYKILLQASKFSDRQQGYQTFWDMVKILADERGVDIKPGYQPFKEKRRIIVFLDTEDFDFRRQNYVLRKRIKYEGGRLRQDFELALKCRGADREYVAAADVSVASRFTPSFEFEEDITLDGDSAGTTKSFWATRTKVELEKSDFRSLYEQAAGLTLENYARIYPGLLKLGIDPNRNIVPVGGLQIDERKVSPAKLDFGDGLVVQADITVWMEEDGKTPMIAEFSYDHSIKDYENMPQTATADCVEFFKELQRAARDWIAFGTTKTDFTYRRGQK